MAKNSFKISNQKAVAKSPTNWMMTLADIPKEFAEDEINTFAEALRTEKFTDEDFMPAKY